ncbi:hypothetical protein [Clostridium cochlearium]|uniref:hypothetical protein n=1 Tax=Clostridium cochlearium TaxID=1494 RepID=UPI00156F8D5A|nr:hypothetical protein [Clostridium cochlearium]MBV1819051.1 hypothetical protein [Bacteroidales bacterium MSK.15.36]MCG4580650.1 hypothetical protein [Clostridium cochlearium]NSJ91264.1 hypothetical protein [Coprococcus sp. MSK.21.13]
MNTLKNQFNQLLKRSGKGFKLTVKDKLIIKEIDDNKNMIDSKYIYVGNNIPLNQGDIIEAIENNWLVLTKNENINNVYSIYTIRKITNIIKIMLPTIESPSFNSKAEVKEFSCFIDDKVFDVETNTNMVLPTDMIYVTMKADETSNKIKRDMRFVQFDSCWKVVGINKTKEGLIKLTAEFSEKTTNDDMENEIADYWKYNQKEEPTEPETPTPDEPTEPKEEDPTVEPEPEIPEEPKEDNITYEFTTDFDYSPFEIPKGLGQTITVHKYNNGEEVEGNFMFTLELNGVKTSDIEKKEVSKNQYYVKNLNVSKKTPIYLIAVDYDNPKEELKQELILKGLF